MTTTRRMMLYLVYSATTFSERALNLQWSKPVKVGALTCFGHPGAHSAWAPGCPCISRRREYLFVPGRGECLIAAHNLGHISRHFVQIVCVRTFPVESSIEDVHPD